MAKPDQQPDIDTWDGLNQVVRGADEEKCNFLLKRELARCAPRQQFLKRIHSRLNKVRAQRERKELEKRAP